MEKIRIILFIIMSAAMCLKSPVFVEAAADYYGAFYDVVEENFSIKVRDTVFVMKSLPNGRYDIEMKRKGIREKIL